MRDDFKRLASDLCANRAQVAEHVRQIAQLQKEEGHLCSRIKSAMLSGHEAENLTIRKVYKGLLFVAHAKQNRSTDSPATTLEIFPVEEVAP